MRTGILAIAIVLAAAGLIGSTYRTKPGGSEIADRSVGSRLEQFATLPQLMAAHESPPSQELVSLGCSISIRSFPEVNPSPAIHATSSPVTERTANRHRQVSRASVAIAIRHRFMPPLSLHSSGTSGRHMYRSKRKILC
jgi:hypothetical protein